MGATSPNMSDPKFDCSDAHRHSGPATLDCDLAGVELRGPRRKREWLWALKVESRVMPSPVPSLGDAQEELRCTGAAGHGFCIPCAQNLV